MSLGTVNTVLAGFVVVLKELAKDTKKLRGDLLEFEGGVDPIDIEDFQKKLERLQASLLLANDELYSLIKPGNLLKAIDLIEKSINPSEVKTGVSKTADDGQENWACGECYSQHHPTESCDDKSEEE